MLDLQAASKGVLEHATEGSGPVLSSTLYFQRFVGSVGAAIRTFEGPRDEWIGEDGVSKDVEECDGIELQYADHGHGPRAEETGTATATRDVTGAVTLKP